MKIKDRVYQQTLHGFEKGTITKIDRTCYKDTHKAFDPWVTIVWDTDPNSIYSSSAVWSVHQAHGTKVTLQNIENQNGKINHCTENLTQLYKVYNVYEV